LPQGYIREHNDNSQGKNAYSRTLLCVSPSNCSGKPLELSGTKLRKWFLGGSCSEVW